MAEPVISPALRAARAAGLEQQGVYLLLTTHRAVGSSTVLLACRQVPVVAVRVRVHVIAAYGRGLV